MHRTVAVALLALLLAACAAQPIRDQTSTESTAAIPLLLVSLDGFHPDYLKRGITPNLQRIADHGVRARWMRPSYPSLTFPNHYTLVTGLRPDHHGIVHNTMRDDALGTFSLHDRDAVGDGRWWGGEPLWVTAQNAGLHAATMFWPGSEAPIAGQRPQRWRPFSADTPMDRRVDTVLGWLDEPADTRPAFITLYFEHIDSAGHQFGPDAAQTDAAIRAVDAALGRLLVGLDARDPKHAINLVVVSDHGMAATSRTRVLLLDDLVDPALLDTITLGQVIGIAPHPGQRARVERALLGAHPHLHCWRKHQLPARWHYGRHRRVPAIVCQAADGWLLTTRANAARNDGRRVGGAHGYDPAAASMRALFIARGPAFRRGAVLPPFDNVDLYPLLARLLGIAPQPNDGNPDTLRAALR